MVDEYKVYVIFFCNIKIGADNLLLNVYFGIEGEKNTLLWKSIEYLPEDVLHNVTRSRMAIKGLSSAS